MATQVFLIHRTDANADTHRGGGGSRLDGVGTGWTVMPCNTTRGTTATFVDSVLTVTGPTNGVEATLAGNPIEFISPPVAQDVTISGTITANIWAHEDNLSANVAINVVIDIIRATDNSIVNIVKSTNTTELGTSSAAVNFTTGMTSGAYTAQTVNRGDRLRIRVFGDDAGTMATGFHYEFRFSGPTGGSAGDTYVTFTETFGFERTPAGTVLYLTDDVSDVNTASVDKVAWLDRGAGVQSIITNTVAGLTTGVQMTDTGGGTVVDWFTPPLQSFTLTGLARANLRALESNIAANASLRCEIARVAGDGTGATVWATWCQAPSGTDNAELGTAEAASTVNVSGDDLAISAGQRLRIRLSIDDTALNAMGASQTVTFFYAGTSAGASGDSYITFPMTFFPPIARFEQVPLMPNPRF